LVDLAQVIAKRGEAMRVARVEHRCPMKVAIALMLRTQLWVSVKLGPPPGLQ
jgi:hypothetical protein